jgi:hypothetical protein
MPYRIVRQNGDLWRIHAEQGKLDAAEERELKDYFNEIRVPYASSTEGDVFRPATRGRRPIIFKLAEPRLLPLNLGTELER